MPTNLRLCLIGDFTFLGSGGGGGSQLASLRLRLPGGLSSLEGDGGRGGGGGGDRGGVNRVVGSVTGMAHCVPLMIDRQLAPLSSIYISNILNSYSVTLPKYF